MGPTRFFPGTHAKARFHDDLERDNVAFATERPSVTGVLDRGDATLYDGRVVHCGGPNDAATRVLFYVTFRHPDADADDLGNDVAHSIVSDLKARHLTLGDFRRPS